METKDLPGVLEALESLLQVLLSNFGPWGTIALIVFAVLASFALRVYNDRRSDKEIDALIEEKDRTIQRLADSERMYRALFLRQQTDWTDDQIERFILQNKFADPVEAREALEEADVDSPNEEDEQGG